MSTGSYYVFDLDETLAEVFPLFSWLDTFHALRDPTSKQTLWDAFVDELLQREQRQPQILRPGILQVMEILAAKQRAGEIRGVVIYSNSTYLESLQMVCDLIHRHLAATVPTVPVPVTLHHVFSNRATPDRATPDRLVLDCVHWNHPHRREEKKNHTETSQKSWEELRKVMIHGRTGAPDTLQPADVYFFDDRIHDALYAALPAKHYIQVPAYQTLMPQEELAEVMRAALERVPRHVAADWRHRVQAKYHQPMMDPVQLIETNGRSNHTSPLYQEVANRLEVGQTRETGQEGIRLMMSVIDPPRSSHTNRSTRENLKTRAIRGGRRAHSIQRTGTIRRKTRTTQKTKRNIRRQ